MIEMRWRIIDRSEWAMPPMGAIMIGQQPQSHFQVLQYRTARNVAMPPGATYGASIGASVEWGEWMDVGFGVPQPSAAKRPNNGRAKNS